MTTVGFAPDGGFGSQLVLESCESTANVTTGAFATGDVVLVLRDCDLAATERGVLAASTPDPLDPEVTLYPQVRAYSTHARSLGEYAGWELVEALHSTLSGCTGSGFLLESCEHVTLNACDATGMFGNGVGIEINGGTHVDVVGGRVAGIGSYGIWMHACTHSRVFGTVVDGTVESGGGTSGLSNHNIRVSSTDDPPTNKVEACDVTRCAYGRWEYDWVGDPEEEPEEVDPDDPLWELVFVEGGRWSMTGRLICTREIVAVFESPTIGDTAGPFRFADYWVAGEVEIVAYGSNVTGTEVTATSHLGPVVATVTAGDTQIELLGVEVWPDDPILGSPAEVELELTDLGASVDRVIVYVRLP